LQNLISTLTTNPKSIFLIDGVGAIVSALLLSVLLGQNVAVFGIPQAVLYKLAALASVFALYSLCCYFFLLGNYKPYLRIIAFANLLYCTITLVLVFVFYQQLTLFGILYFINEKIVVGSLVYLELKASRPSE
jgi:hypothetical protein